MLVMSRCLQFSYDPSVNLLCSYYLHGFRIEVNLLLVWTKFDWCENNLMLSFCGLLASLVIIYVLACGIYYVLLHLFMF